MAVVAGVHAVRGHPVLTATLKRLLERYGADSELIACGNGGDHAGQRAEGEQE